MESASCVCGHADSSFNMNDVRQEIRRFVVDQFLFGEEDGLADDASLLELGVVDSTGVLELVTHIETTYGFKVADEELVPDNLDSVHSLTEFVQRKKQEAPAGPPAA